MNRIILNSKVLLATLALYGTLSAAQTPAVHADAPVAAPATTTTASPNLALNKKYEVSDPNTHKYGIGGLTDGSFESGSNHTFATNESATFPKTATIDLESVASVGYVVVGVPPFGSTKTVAVSLSTDGQTFTNVGQHVFSLNKAENYLYSFPAAQARYVRLNYLDNYTEQAGFPNGFMFATEAEVYAPGNAPAVKVAITPVKTPPEFTDQPLPKFGMDGLINPSFQAQHESFLKRGKEGKIGVLFIGDSITAGWRSAPAIWKEHFGKYDPANFGISGDRTAHVLWRIANGELDGITPKVVVLMIGTNNIGNSAPDILKGDTKIVSEIHAKLPDAKVLLLGIFPRGADVVQSAKVRDRIREVNRGLAQLDDGNKTRFLDIGDKFLDGNGNLPADVMPDALHPNVKGYQIWADAIQPLLDEMMK